MRVLAIITIVNGLAYASYGGYMFYEYGDRIDSSDDWFLVLWILLAVLSGIFSALFAARTLRWHALEDHHASEDLIDLAWEDTGPALEVEGFLRLMQVVGIVGLTIGCGYLLLILFFGTRYSGSVEVLDATIQLVLAGTGIASIVYLARTWNIRKQRPQA